MLLDNDDITLQRINERNHRPRWVFYGVLALVILAPIAAWLVRRKHTPEPVPPPASSETTTASPQQQATPAEATRPAQPAVSPAIRQSAQSTQPLPTQIQALLAENRHEEARALAYQFIESANDAAARAEAEERLSALNTTMLFSPAPMPEKTEYTVQKGDSLDRIAKKFGTTIDLLRISNEIKGDRININDRLRVFTGTCTLLVSKTRNDMVLQINDRFFKRYRVGTGKFGKTPVGTFAIDIKLKDPPWTRPSDKKIIPYGDPENVLGTRWMSIKAIEGTEPVDGYGIHGTIEPETVGMQSSDGCIRLVNADVEELYTIVPEGTRVVITD